MISPELIQHFEKIFIDEKSRGSELSQRILEIFPEEKIEFVQTAPLSSKGPLTAEQFDRSKKLLYVKPFEGLFFKRCPGASLKPWRLSNQICHTGLALAKSLTA